MEKDEALKPEISDEVKVAKMSLSSMYGKFHRAYEEPEWLRNMRLILDDQDGKIIARTIDGRVLRTWAYNGAAELAAITPNILVYARGYNLGLDALALIMRAFV